MCFVLTPYYHLCGHYGHPVVAPHGRCARAEQTSGTCSETHDIGIKTVEAKCVDCERMVNSTIIRHPLTARVGPVDCQKFNQLVKLHKQTFDRRRYWPSLSVYQCHQLTSNTVPALQVSLLQSHRPPSCRLQTKWLFAGLVRPARFLPYPLRPARSQQKDDSRFLLSTRRDQPSIN